MVYFRPPQNVDAGALVSGALKDGLLIGPSGAGRIRMVTHLGLDESSVRRAVEILKEIIR
jgi:4-aminobutyrate aminotransferase-like enzyme